MAGMRKSKFELADVVCKFGKALIEKEKLSPGQVKALYNILQCRTSALGGHEEECDHCKEVRYSYNSCGDRHCPKCQNTKQAIWVEDLMKSTLPVKHYHIIFTVPHCLNDLCIWDSSMYYKILFSAVWRTLHSFGYTHHGAETGAIAVLHSWGQNLWIHPHIHCIVPAAGYNLKGNWINIGKTEKYLYPVHQLSDTFKGKFLDSIKRMLNKKGMPDAFSSQVINAENKRWVVHSEPSLASAEHVIRYLGQYTHRVAISNQRIINISDTHVTFISKNYRDRGQNKPVKLDGVEFLRRFCMHVFPKGFTRIRRYGIYNHTVIRNLELKFVPDDKNNIETIAKSKEKETTTERVIRLIGFDIGLCPKCKIGRMHIIRKLPRIRSPAGHLPSILFSKLI